MNAERKRKTMDYIKAFLIGGMICALAQVLLDRTRLMPGRVMVLLVVSGCILGFAGVYEPFARWAGAGASVPLLGFGNTLWKGVKEGIENRLTDSIETVMSLSLA